MVFFVFVNRIIFRFYYLIMLIKYGIIYLRINSYRSFSDVINVNKKVFNN